MLVAGRMSSERTPRPVYNPFASVKRIGQMAQGSKLRYGRGGNTAHLAEGLPGRKIEAGAGGPVRPACWEQCLACSRRMSREHVRIG